MLLGETLPILRAREIVSSGAFTSEEGMVKVLEAQARLMITSRAPVIEYSSFVPRAQIVKCNRNNRNLTLEFVTAMAWYCASEV